MFAFITGTAAVVGTIRLHLMNRKVKASAALLKSRLEQGASDRRFTHWATWTMLSVTDSKGYVHAATLRQLYETGHWDAVWDTPVAVALWHGDPDAVKRYEAEIKGAQGDTNV